MSLYRIIIPSLIFILSLKIHSIDICAEYFNVGNFASISYSVKCMEMKYKHSNHCGFWWMKAYKMYLFYSLHMLTRRNSFMFN